eukprot:TRINITY_DN4012_c0_g1_i1.p1 TRINITY_DN4012_c0_g1~~TRINITY_DN4012_c0_g1_i1.p1  ORF type:complete len:340 (-),score=100.29 TRINITY_DN4012_c0_g1_i1:29-1048(-)
MRRGTSSLILLCKRQPSSTSNLHINITKRYYAKGGGKGGGGKGGKAKVVVKKLTPKERQVALSKLKPNELGYIDPNVATRPDLSPAQLHKFFRFEYSPKTSHPTSWALLRSDSSPLGDHNRLIYRYGKKGDLESMRRSYCELLHSKSNLKPNGVTYDILINFYMVNGYFKQAYTSLYWMRKNGFPANSYWSKMCLRINQFYLWEKMMNKGSFSEELEAELAEDLPVEWDKHGKDMWMYWSRRTFRMRFVGMEEIWRPKIGDLKDMGKLDEYIGPRREVNMSVMDWVRFAQQPKSEKDKNWKWSNKDPYAPPPNYAAECLKREQEQNSGNNNNNKEEVKN